jgi:hypothetical protein
MAEEVRPHSSLVRVQIMATQVDGCRRVYEVEVEVEVVESVERINNVEG